jgi:hypothetical protein
MDFYNAINVAHFDAGYDSLNWEERLHIALDAAQGQYFEIHMNFLL